MSSITASDLTGNVVVQFDATSGLDSIIDYLAALLRGEIITPGEMPDAGPEWHTLSPKQSCFKLEASADAGLPGDEARRRLASTGPNILENIQPRSRASILADQFQSLPVAMLLGAASVSILTGGAFEAAVILAVVGLNAVIGYQTESRAERTIQSLGAKGPQTAQIMREGVIATVPVQQIVPGDVLTVQRGDVVPADARLLNEEALTISEALLTGESPPIQKTVGAIERVNVPLGSRSNMIYRGTIVTGGGGRAIVVATGSLTQAGRIQRLVGATFAPETPLQRELKNLGQRLGWLTLGTCAVLFSLGWLRGIGLLQMARSAMSVAVAAVPEGLPMVATTTFALGIEKLRREGVLIRKLDAVETLAAARVVCFDKTGTLTLGHIDVDTIRIGERSRAAAIGLIGLGAYRATQGNVFGPATENFWNAFGALRILNNPYIALVFGGLGLVQLARGRWAGSASSLLFYALVVRQISGLNVRTRPGLVLHAFGRDRGQRSI
ncbi:HAD-IC family P-type ATPase [Mesorhizobium onobrychidis]|uniref:HAD-IC family P-type ATPase n=1 Tax=Mesorhizobium onobrychidis TaxID=2775404 RepID=A0ABY5R8N5_9HYPH|nr:HAD-IC family P-type ATPase [Mesorhizobium onobrychidis]UVC19342.1 HAD-IC family P-type ATPase [Mesorhizobium onobrychidis]